MKKCPYCSRELVDSVIICHHCGKTLPSEKANDSSVDNFIKKHIKRTNRNLLLTNIAIIIGIFLLWLNNAFSEAGYWKLIILGLFILACRNIVLFWKRNKNPSLHPIITALSKIGPPEKVAAMINEESKAPKLEVKSFIITNSWLLKSSIYGLEPILLGELAWVHSKVTSHYTYGVPSGKSYSVCIYKRDGKSFEVACDELASSMLIGRVTEVAPWVVGGYNAEIKKFWDTDRQGFIAYVDQRKRERNAG